LKKIIFQKKKKEKKNCVLFGALRRENVRVFGVTVVFKNLTFVFQFELMERKRARTEFEKMLFRQEMEAEELRISSESALKELQQLQVSCS